MINFDFRCQFFIHTRLEDCSRLSLSEMTWDIDGHRIIGLNRIESDWQDDCFSSPIMRDRRIKAYGRQPLNMSPKNTDGRTGWETKQDEGGGSDSLSVLTLGQGLADIDLIHLVDKLFSWQHVVMQFLSPEISSGRRAACSSQSMSTIQQLQFHPCFHASFNDVFNLLSTNYWLGDGGSYGEVCGKCCVD